MPSLTSLPNDFYALLAALAFAGMAVPTVFGYISRARHVQDLAMKLRKGRSSRDAQSQDKSARISLRKNSILNGFGRR